MEEEKKVSDESIVEEAKGETPEETTTEEGTETQETKETKTRKYSVVPLPIMQTYPLSLKNG